MSSHEAVRLSRHSKQRAYLQNICTRLQDLQITPFLVYIPTWDTTIVIYHFLFLMRKQNKKWPPFLGVWKQWHDIVPSWLCGFGSQDREHTQFSLKGCQDFLVRKDFLIRSQKDKMNYTQGHSSSFSGGLQRLTFWSRPEWGEGSAGWLELMLLQVDDSVTKQELPGYQGLRN